MPSSTGVGRYGGSSMLDVGFTDLTSFRRDSSSSLREPIKNFECNYERELELMNVWWSLSP